uniref:Uncharacterized protein n=1 Tax=Medicago truncatula TaxID=3880 RepID=I3S7S3_MEDTR|nr:unknown [Medicago truncatula]
MKNSPVSHRRKTRSQTDGSPLRRTAVMMERRWRKWVPTITSIKMRTKNTNKGIHEEQRHRQREREYEEPNEFHATYDVFFFFERENEK